MVHRNKYYIQIKVLVMEKWIIINLLEQSHCTLISVLVKEKK